MWRKFLDGFWLNYNQQLCLEMKKINLSMHLLILQTIKKSDDAKSVLHWRLTAMCHCIVMMQQLKEKCSLFKHYSADMLFGTSQGFIVFMCLNTLTLSTLETEWKEVLLWQLPPKNHSFGKALKRMLHPQQGLWRRDWRF